MSDSTSLLLAVVSTAGQYCQAPPSVDKAARQSEWRERFEGVVAGEARATTAEAGRDYDPSRGRSVSLCRVSLCRVSATLRQLKQAYRMRHAGTSWRELPIITETIASAH